MRAQFGSPTSTGHALFGVLPSNSPIRTQVQQAAILHQQQMQQLSRSPTATHYNIPYSTPASSHQINKINRTRNFNSVNTTTGGNIFQSASITNPQNTMNEINQHPFAITT